MRTIGQIAAARGGCRFGFFFVVLSSATDSTLLSTLPARALLGRLLAVRLSLIGGWAAGIVWLHWGLRIPMPLLPMGAVLLLMGMFSLSTAWLLLLDLPATQMV